MPAERYVFTATGQDVVRAAYKSIGDAARDSSRQEAAAARTTAAAFRASARGAAGVTTERATAGSRTAQLAQRVAADQERAAKRGAAAEAREAKRSADAQVRAREQVFQIRARYDAQETRAAERRASQEARIRDRHQRAELRAQQQIAEGRRARLGRIAEGGADRILGTASNIALGGAALVTGVVGAAARESVKLGDLSARIAINARESGKDAIDPQVLRREFEATALATPGQSATDVAEAVQAFVGKTGRLDVARAQQKTFATVASATGGDVQDVAAAAADLFQKFDIKSIEDMQAAFAALAIQGKEGSFELKDAASQFAKLSAAASRFGLDKGASGVATLGGLTQIARSATGSPEQAASAVEATLRQLVSKSGDIKRDLGVDVFSDKGKTRTRNVQDVLVETIGGAKGSLPKLQEIFGEEGIRGISPLISTFNEAKAKSGAKDEAGKVADGMAALRAQLDKAINVTGGWAEVQRDASLAQQTAGATLSAAWESVKANVSESLTPALLELAPKLIELAPAIIPIIELFGQLASALGAFLEMLAEFGIIDKREKATKAPVDAAQQDVQKKIDQIEGGEGPMSADDVAEVQRLEEQRALLDEAHDSAVAADVAQSKGQGSYTPLADLSEEEYAAKRAALADPEMVARQKMRPGEVLEDTKAQKDLDKARHAEQVNKASPSGGDAGAKAQQDAALALKDAAAALKEAAAKGQPSIIGPG